MRSAWLSLPANFSFLCSLPTNLPPGCRWHNLKHVRRCHPTSLEQSHNFASTQERSNIGPPKITVCWLSIINGCIYRLFAIVVRDLLTGWAFAEQQIPDSQFSFCPTRNTNQPLFILCHILATAKKEKRCTLLLWTLCCLRRYSIPRGL